jgi:NAD+ diphosphatase
MHEPVQAPTERSARVGFGRNPLDRQANRRDDEAFLAARRADATSRTVVIVCDRPVLKSSGGRLDPLFTLPEAKALGEPAVTALLGCLPEGAVFGTLLDDGAVTVVQGTDPGSFLDRRFISMPGRDDLAFIDMRAIAAQGLLDPDLVGILGQAKSLLYWHARHRFCPNCGAPTRVAAAGWRRECDACKAQHFPRTDPVVIMLAVDGERCLLGRQARFPKGMYSCLAGFIEAGETMEDAVRREIAEEAGIATGRVTYLASQPWPFPSSLMIGCIAQAATTDVVIDAVELEDARWFARDEARAMLAGSHPDGLAAPQPLAIAHHIIRAWALEGATV